jgi:hypothetical protein
VGQIHHRPCSAHGSSRRFANKRFRPPPPEPRYTQHCCSTVPSAAPMTAMRARRRQDRVTLPPPGSAGSRSPPQVSCQIGRLKTLRGGVLPARQGHENIGAPAIGAIQFACQVLGGSIPFGHEPDLTSRVEGGTGAFPVHRESMSRTVPRPIPPKTCCRAHRKACDVSCR